MTNPSDVRRLALEMLLDYWSGTQKYKLLESLSTGRLIVTEPPATGVDTIRLVIGGKEYLNLPREAFVEIHQLRAALGKAKKELTALQLRFDAHIRGTTNE